MTVHRGDVVLVHFPFASGGGAGKLRPAIVVQNDRDNRRLRNVIVAAITTRTQHSAQPTQRLIDPASAEGQAAGLKHLSVVSCENLATVEQSLVARRIGSLPTAVMAEVDACLRAALQI